MSRGRVAIFAAVLFSVAFLLSPYSPINLSDPQPTFPQYTQEYQYPLEPHAHVLNQTQPKRVAIIGAGASGTSAAWFLTRAGSVMEQRMGLAKGSLLGEVVVYDREGHVGGRTTTVFPHGDERLRPIELGASIFVSANRHLVKGAKRFGLKTIDPDFGESGVGIWDGKEFLYQTSTSKSRYSNWYDSLTALRRYGPLSPFRTQKAISALLVKFANLYNPEWLNQRGAAKNIEEFAERVGLGREYTTRRGDEWATGAVGVNKQWAGEVWDSSTRVNYGSDMNQIHALGAAVSLATRGAQAVEGGNFRIFEGMMDESKATLRLGTEVLDIKPIHRSGDPPSFTVITNSSEASTGPFNQIFYASPWYSSPKDKGMRGLQSNLIEPIHYTKYVRLHVTLLTTTRAAPLPSFFGLPDTAVVPSTILTTSYTSHTKAATPPPKFQSITWHGETYEGSGEHVVKIFSLHYLNQEFLTDLIGEEPGWLLRKEWDSYPELRPVSSFPPIEPVKGVQYLGALEPWVSTMETQTLSAREAVARVVQDWWGLGYGECRGGADAWDWSCEE